MDTNSNNIVNINNNLDKFKKTTDQGAEYWTARSLQLILGYDKWDNFENVINKAMMACESAGINPNNHFLEIGKMIAIGKGGQRERGDYYLSRIACYLIAMNGDPSKPEIGIAQQYFAHKTRQQELQDQLPEKERRMMLRDRVKEANKSLGMAAKNAGVQGTGYALFHNAGYMGLYGMGLANIKEKKKIPQKEDLLDRAGRTELAANEFRITQTEEKLRRDKIDNQNSAIKTHQEVGQQVRNTIKNLGGTMPEDLPTEESIKKLTNKQRKEINIKRKPKLTN